MQIKILTLLISTFLPWIAFDENLFRRRKSLFTSNEVETSLSLAGEQLRQKQKIKQHRLDVIPHWQRGIKKPLRLKCNYFSTKPRDVRYSDQQKIRRRINNM